MSIGSLQRVSAGGRCCPSGRPKGRTGSPYMSPSAFAGSPTRLARPDAQGGSARRRRDFRRSQRVLDRRLARRRPSMAAARSRIRCASSENGRRVRRVRGLRAACYVFGDLPIYVSPGGADHRGRPRLFQHGVVAGVPPDYSRRRASSGETRSTTGRRCGRALPLVDRALPPELRARRPDPGRSLPRVRRLLGGAGRQNTAAGTGLAACPGADYSRGANRSRRPAAHRRGSRCDHRRSAPPATSSGSRAWSSCSSHSARPQEPARAAEPRGNRSSTPARTTTTRPRLVGVALRRDRTRAEPIPPIRPGRSWPPRGPRARPSRSRRYRMSSTSARPPG